MFGLDWWIAEVSDDCSKRFKEFHAKADKRWTTDGGRKTNACTKWLENGPWRGEGYEDYEDEYDTAAGCDRGHYCRGRHPQVKLSWDGQRCVADLSEHLDVYSDALQRAGCARAGLPYVPPPAMKCSKKRGCGATLVVKCARSAANAGRLYRSCPACGEFGGFVPLPARYSTDRVSLRVLYQRLSDPSLPKRARLDAWHIKLPKTALEASDEATRATRDPPLRPSSHGAVGWSDDDVLYLIAERATLFTLFQMRRASKALARAALHAGLSRLRDVRLELSALPRTQRGVAALPIGALSGGVFRQACSLSDAASAPPPLRTAGGEVTVRDGVLTARPSGWRLAAPPDLACSVALFWHPQPCDGVPCEPIEVPCGPGHGASVSPDIGAKTSSRAAFRGALQGAAEFTEVSVSLPTLIKLSARRDSRLMKLLRREEDEGTPRHTEPMSSLELALCDDVRAACSMQLLPRPRRRPRTASAFLAEDDGVEFEAALAAMPMGDGHAEGAAFFADEDGGDFEAALAAMPLPA